MVSVTKASSDTRLHHHQLTPSLLPLTLLSSEHTNNVSKYRSRNNISSKKRLHNYSFRQSMESIGENDQKFSNNNLISTHFPIANIQQDSVIISKTSSSQSPTVPRQAGAFIHRLVNKFFSITNMNSNKKDLSDVKRMKQEPVNTTTLNTRNVSDDSHTCLSLLPIKRKRRRRQRSKVITDKNNCTVCRNYRNCFSIYPINQIQPLSTDSFALTCQSPMILNSNAATTTQNNHVILTTQPSTALSKDQLEKKRILNESQCQTIASAVELIFNTLISNYQ